MEFTKSHQLILCITAFFGMAGGTLLAPVLPEMVAPLHMTSAEVALLISVLTISTAIFTLLIAHYIDRVNRKTVLIPCLLVYGLTGLFCFFVSDMQSLLVLRFLQGIGVAGMLTLPLLMIGDVFKGHDSVKPISTISISFAIGAISVPLIGGFMAMVAWNLPFLFYALALPFALVVWAFLPETRGVEHTGNRNGIKEAFLALRDIRVFSAVFMGFAVYVLLFAMVIYVPFLLKNLFSYSSGSSGIMLAIEGIAVILVASRVHSLTRKYSVVPVIALGFALVGASLVLMAFFPLIAAIVLLLILFGAGYGLAQTSVDVLTVQVAPPENRGGILSIHTCGKYLGGSIAPVILGIVLIFSGMEGVFVLAGIFGLVMAAMAYGIRKKYAGPAGAEGQ